MESNESECEREGFWDEVIDDPLAIPKPGYQNLARQRLGAGWGKYKLKILKRLFKQKRDNNDYSSIQVDPECKICHAQLSSKVFKLTYNFDDDLDKRHHKGYYYDYENTIKEKSYLVPENYLHYLKEHQIDLSPDFEVFIGSQVILSDIPGYQPN